MLENKDALGVVQLLPMDAVHRHVRVDATRRLIRRIVRPTQTH